LKLSRPTISIAFTPQPLTLTTTDVIPIDFTRLSDYSTIKSITNQFQIFFSLASLLGAFVESQIYFFNRNPSGSGRFMKRAVTHIERW
jgi:hypothetical protein